MWRLLGCCYPHVQPVTKILAIFADDGLAWLTLLVFLVVPLMLADGVPLWLAVLILSVVTLIGIYLVLPWGKGIFIALIWLTGTTGQNEFSDSSDSSMTKCPFFAKYQQCGLPSHYCAPAWLLKRICQNMKIDDYYLQK